MKSICTGSWVLIGALLLSGAALAEVYRTVDEHGNVIYTDQPPGPDAEAMELKGLTVVPVPQASLKAVRATDSSANEDGKVENLGALRRGYRDFRLTQPLPEQTFAGTGNQASIAWETQYALQDGMKVIISIDGQPLPPTTSQLITSEQLDRGEHTVSAQLVDSKNRIIANAQPVTFFINQNSVNFNRQAIRPAGGG